MNDYAWILGTIATIILAIIAMNQFGIEIMPVLSYAILIAIVAYLLIAARCCLVRTQEPKTSADLNAKIDMLKDSLGRIEEKVDKIDRILEKVSE